MKRRGFTLVELLVVITILVVLASMIVAALPTSAGKARDAGRILQTTILGARDRAARATAPRGFRLQVDPANPNLATAIVFIQPMDPQRYGRLRSDPLNQTRIDVRRPSGEYLPTEVHGHGTDWISLQTGKFLPPRLFHVQIPDETGDFYVGYNLRQVGADEVFDLHKGCEVVDIDGAWPAVIALSPNSANASLRLFLNNEIAPQTSAVYLPSGIVIDLSPGRSSVAASTDILFSPRGPVTLNNAAAGPIHLFVRDVRDALATGSAGGLDPSSQSLQGDQIIVTIFPQTGHVAVYPVDPTDADRDGQVDDAFSFAKKGQAAGG